MKRECGRLDMPTLFASIYFTQERKNASFYSVNFCECTQNELLHLKCSPADLKNITVITYPE
jgi:hypothetical protein